MVVKYLMNIKFTSAGFFACVTGTISFCPSFLSSIISVVISPAGAVFSDRNCRTFLSDEKIGASILCSVDRSRR
jgi:hypothetical protein